MESLASVVAENLPKLPVAAEAGGLDVAGEAFQRRGVLRWKSGKERRS